jgi:16S rRNA (cytidine1402-2'-O)-methyltransferase
MSGTLYVVATPIGNLDDITFRAVRILREADIIACEDTRQTRKLLDHFEISRPLVSYHDHNERERAAQLLAELENGRSVAVVSDAGTPLIADPGYRIVKEARERGIPVSPIPGPSALPAALSASGLPTDAFVFGGFLAAKSGQRRKELEKWKDAAATLVFYETPHRICETLRDIAEILGERTVVIAREITKLHEEFLRGTPLELEAELSKRPAVKGEFVVMIDRRSAPGEFALGIEDAVAELTSRGVAKMDAVKQVARERGLSKHDVYQRLEGRLR